MNCEKECNNFVTCRFSDEGKQKDQCNFFLPKTINSMDAFEEWADSNLYGIYRPIKRSANGKGYTNEYTQECWLAWEAGKKLAKETLT